MAPRNFNLGTIWGVWSVSRLGRFTPTVRSWYLLKMKPTQSSETSAFNTQTPGKYPEDNLSLLQHGESLKIRILVPVSAGHWVVPTDSSDALKETEISCPCQKPKHDSSSLTQTVTQPLFWPRYPGTCSQYSKHAILASVVTILTTVSWHL
jgi:hypothetical protein